jgi:tetratricopeptide (TPR) repeat protein
LRKKFFTVLVLIAVTLCPVYVPAQQENSKPQAKDDAQAALREKAYALLESLAGQLGTMQSAENRARIGSNIAWSLWSHNETRAREVLASVQQDINAGLQVPESQDPEDVHSLLVFMRLRTETVERIAQHDPELAYEFFKATALSPDLKLSEQVKSGQEQLEGQLARQIAANNPKIALQLARKLLQHGFSDELIVLVRKLGRKDKESAMELYKDIVQKLSERDLAQETEFALTLAHSFSPPEVRESDFRDLINLFVKMAVENGCTKKMSEEDPRIETCGGLTPALGLIAKVNPARAKQLEFWKSDDGEGFYKAPSAYSELNEATEGGTVDEVLALIAKYPELDIPIRWQAFRKAEMGGDFERAEKIANDSSLEPEQRQQMRIEVEHTKAQATINDQTIADVTKRLEEIKGTEEQVLYLMGIASRLSEKDRKTALKLLNQASQIVDTMKPGRGQTMSRVGLALIYCQHQSDRGFQIMESLLPKLNELVDASAKLDGYGSRSLRDGEWNMIGDGLIGQLLTGLAQNAGYFAWCDFDRAVTLTGQFDRAEIRMMAQLKLAQGILAGPPKSVPIRIVRDEYLY